MNRQEKLYNALVKETQSPRFSQGTALRSSYSARKEAHILSQVSPRGLVTTQSQSSLCLSHKHSLPIREDSQSIISEYQPTLYTAHQRSDTRTMIDFEDESNISFSSSMCLPQRVPATERGLTSANRKLEKDYKFLAGKLKRAQHRIEEQEKAAESHLNAHLEELSQGKTTHLEEMRRLRTRHETQLQPLKQLLDEIKDQNTKLKQEKTALKKEIAQLKTGLKDQEKAVTQNEELAGEVRTLKEERVQQRKECSRLNSELNQLSNQLRNCEKLSNQLEKKAKHEKELQRTINQLTGEHSESLNKLAIEHNALTHSLNNQIKLLKHEALHLRNTVNSQETDLETMNNRRKSLEQKLKSHRDFQPENERLLTQQTQLTDSLETLKTEEKRRLKAQKLKYEAALTELNTYIEHANSQIIQLRKEKLQQIKAAAILSVSLKEQQQETMATAQLKTSLQKALHREQSLKEGLQQLKIQSLAQLTQLQTEYESQLSLFKTDISQTKAQLLEFKHKNQQLSETITEQEQQITGPLDILEYQTQRISDFQQQLARNKSKLHTLRTKHAQETESLSTEVARLNKQLSQTEQNTQRVTFAYQSVVSLLKQEIESLKEPGAPPQRVQESTPF